MKTRIITGAALTAVLIPTLIFSHTPLFVIMLALFAFMGEYEMLHCLGLEKNIAISLPAYILAVGLPVGARYITNGMFMQYAFVAIAICFLWMLAAYTFSKGKVTLEQAGGCRADIPELAFVSIHTVKKHNHSIYQKLEVASRDELMLYIEMFRCCDPMHELTGDGNEE